MSVVVCRCPLERWLSRADHDWRMEYTDVVHDLRSNYEDQHDMPVEVGTGLGRGLDSVYAGRGRRFIESRDGRKSLEHLVSYVNKETSIKELTTT